MRALKRATSAAAHVCVSVGTDDWMAAVSPMTSLSVVSSRGGTRRPILLCTRRRGNAWNAGCSSSAERLSMVGEEEVGVEG